MANEFLKDLLLITKDGEWGKGEPADGLSEMTVIRGADFSDVRLGRLTEAPTRYIPTHIAERKKLQPTDILIETAGGTRDQPTGRTVFLKHRLFQTHPRPLTCASFSRFLRVNPALAHPEFVYWYLQSLYAAGEMEQHQIQHTGVARFQYTKFAEATRIPLPSLPEQRAIASVLGALEDKIELNRRMNETLETLAQTLFKSWFIDPAAAKLPKGWQEIKLGQVAENASQTFDFSTVSEVVFVNTGDVLSGDFLHTTRSSKIGLPGQAKKVIRQNDILFSEIRPGNRRFAYVDFDPKDFVVSTKFMVIRASKKIQPRILYRFLTSKEALEEFQIEAESRSGTFPQITFDSIGHFKIKLPPTEAQQEFIQTVSPLELRIKANKQESRTLAELRDTLLPKLLSGELRIPAKNSKT